ncbi:MAG: glycosyltransferase family 39 protein [Acidobacteriia bacterium]|nr:glycosyltransferase family 39 protein [Terriglobia bacterium]
MPQRRHALVVAAAFVALATSLSTVRPLWLDEVLQLIETRKASARELITDIQSIPGAVPLGFLVQQAQLRITGYSLVRARLTAALFGGASLYIVVLLAAEAGLLRPWSAGLIFAFFPLTLRYATESRVYSQALFFSALATLLQVRLSNRPGRRLAIAYSLALSAAVYTQPYAVFVSVAHLIWLAGRRRWRCALISGLALLIAGLAFLPWFLRSNARWNLRSANSAFHFHVSPATPLMLFREWIGAGYWGSACLVLLCPLVFRKRLQMADEISLFLLIPPVVLISALAADAQFDYFIAARQFLWVLPSVAILAAMAIEREPRIALPLAAVLAVFCLRQSGLFFLRPTENWQAAADAILEQVHHGAGWAVVPPEQAPLYGFFHPELPRGPAISDRIVLAITPAATEKQRQRATAAYAAAGYEVEQERTVGGSLIISLHRRQKERRKLSSAERGPPLSKSGGNPVLADPEPSMRFCIEVDCPNHGLERNGTGSANAGWLRTLKTFNPTSSDNPRKRANWRCRLASS